MEEANSGLCLSRSCQASEKTAFSVFTRLLRGRVGVALGVLWAAKRMPGARAIKARRRAKKFSTRNKRIPELARGWLSLSAVYQSARANRAGLEIRHVTKIHTKSGNRRGGGLVRRLRKNS